MSDCCEIGPRHLYLQVDPSLGLALGKSAAGTLQPACSTPVCVETMPLISPTLGEAEHFLLSKRSPHPTRIAWHSLDPNESLVS